MATSKEERERRRAERLAAEQAEAASARRRLMFGYVAAGVLTLAVVVGIVVAIAGGGGGEATVDGEEIPDEAHVELASGSVNGVQPDGRTGTPPPAVQQADLETAAREAGCEVRLDLPDEGSTHFEQPADAPDYGTEPPTSGDHIVPPRQQADGAYAEPVGAPFVVHALEHGRIAIQYSPDLPEPDQLELKGLFDEDPAGMLLFPNPDMPYEVAATAWTQLVGCERYEGGATLDVLRAFRDIYRGQGPEPVAIAF
jgi:Protein of unknown function (DUF3105)